MLLLQDLAVLPLLTLVPLLGRADADVLSALGMAGLKAAGAFLAIFAVGRLALRPLLRVVARAGDPELFTGIALLLVLGVGGLTQLAGLSMALGAFLAGVLIAETEYRPQVEGDVQPFRGILLALFFMTVGMSIDIGLVAERGPLLAGLLAALLVTKSGLLALGSRAFGLTWPAAASVGIMLAQGGEFGFVLFALAGDARVLTPELEQLAVLVVGLSMALTPLLMAGAVRSRGACRPRTMRPARPPSVSFGTTCSSPGSAGWGGRWSGCSSRATSRGWRSISTTTGSPRPGVAGSRCSLATPVGRTCSARSAWSARGSR